MEASSLQRVELPTSFEDVPIEHLVELIADMLQRLMAHNDKIPLTPENLTRFHSRSVPSISVSDYLKRIVRFTNVEKSVLLLTLHYIDQISVRMPTFMFSSLTCHRFLISTITVSSKGLCDAFCTNQIYAKVGGITTTELNTLEREFLSAIDWHLVYHYFLHQCSRELLHEYYINLVRTNSTGHYILTGDSPDSPSGTDSDIDIDSGQSRDSSPDISTSPTSPTRTTSNYRHRSSESASAILIDPGTYGYSPENMHRTTATLEQNMAFAALQESQSRSRLRHQNYPEDQS